MVGEQRYTVIIEFMKSVGIFFTLVFFAFIAWMNVTAGHFQYDCVGVSYQKQGYNCQILPQPNNSITDKLFILLSNFDLYK